MWIWAVGGGGGERQPDSPCSMYWAHHATCFPPLPHKIGLDLQCRAADTPSHQPRLGQPSTSSSLDWFCTPPCTPNSHSLPPHQLQAYLKLPLEQAKKGEPTQHCHLGWWACSSRTALAVQASWGTWRAGMSHEGWRVEEL